MAEPAQRESTDPSPGADVLRFPSHRLPATGAPDPQPRLRTVIGDVLRDERHRQGRTLADVADGAAVSLPYLSEVERGTKEVSSDLLAAICDELDLGLLDVLERSADRFRTLRSLRPGGSSVQALAA